jgi:hypothetical protein
MLDSSENIFPIAHIAYLHTYSILQDLSVQIYYLIGV